MRIRALSSPSSFIWMVVLGKTTSVSVKSPWPSPSFDGAFLPLSKKIDPDGFSATWKVLHLNRPIPQAWAGSIPASSGGILTNEITTNKARVTPDLLVLQMNWGTILLGLNFTYPRMFTKKPLVWQNMPFCFWCLVLCLSSSQKFCKGHRFTPFSIYWLALQFSFFICCFYHYPSIWVLTWPT